MECDPAEFSAEEVTRFVNLSILISKLVKAAQQTGIRDICIAGGVSANSGLRQAVKDAGVQHGWKVYIPAFEYCTDNGAMIAVTGYYHLLAGKTGALSARTSAKADWD